MPNAVLILTAIPSFDSNCIYLTVLNAAMRYFYQKVILSILYIFFVQLAPLHVFAGERNPIVENNGYKKNNEPIHDKNLVESARKGKKKGIAKEVTSVKVQKKRSVPTTKHAGPDPFRFTITFAKDTIRVKDELEATVTVDWVDYGIASGVHFLPHWYQYTLKVVFPEGFVQTGGDYTDYCTKLVDANNTTVSFKIKGYFNAIPAKPTFTILRGFEGANEKSDFLLKEEKSIVVLPPRPSSLLVSPRGDCDIDIPSIYSNNPYYNCAGASTISLLAGCGDIGSPVWYSDASTTATLGTGTNLNVSGLSDRTYYVSCKSASWCESARIGVSVKPASGVSQPTVTNTSFCTSDNGSITLSATCASGNVNWYNSNYQYVASGATYAPNIGANTSQSFYVSCKSTTCESSFKQISVYRKPTVTLSTTSVSVCEGGIVSITASGGATYVWKLPDNTTSTNASLYLENVAQTKAGTYTVTATSALGGCVSTPANATVNITSNPNPTPSIFATETSVGQGMGTILTATGGNKFEWVGPNNFTSTQQQVSISEFSTTKAGTYKVYVGNTANTCTRVASIDVAYKSCPFVVNTAMTTCEGTNTLNLSASGGDTYRWEGPNGFVSTEATPLLTNIRQSTHQGIYRVVVTKSSPACISAYNVALTVTKSSFSLTIVDETKRNTCPQQYTLKATGCPPKSTYNWYAVRNAKNNKIAPTLTLKSTSNTTMYYYPAIGQGQDTTYVVECIPPTSTTCVPKSEYFSPTLISNPSIKITGIKQACELADNGNALVTFEVQNASYQTSFAWEAYYNSEPYRDWYTVTTNVAISNLYTSSYGYSYNGDYSDNTGYYIRYLKNGMEYRINLDAISFPPNTVFNISPVGKQFIAERRGNTYTVRLPSNSFGLRGENELGNIYLLDDQTHCIAKSEDFILSKPNTALSIPSNNSFSFDYTPHVNVLCNGNIGERVFSLRRNYSDTPTLFQGNKELMTNIKPEDIRVFNGNTEIVNNLTKNISVVDKENVTVSVKGLAINATINPQNAYTKPYKVVVKAGDGCQYETTSFAVVSPPALTLNMADTPGDCYGDTPKKIVLSAAGGTSIESKGYQFYIKKDTNWIALNPVVSGKLSPLQTISVEAATLKNIPKPYKFKVVDLNGCSLEDSLTTSSLQPFVSKAVVDDYETDLIQLSVGGGNTPRYYAVVKSGTTLQPQDWSSISDTDVTLKKITTAGKYDVYFKYGTCTAFAKHEVTIKTKPLPEVPAVKQSLICASSKSNVLNQIVTDGTLKWYETSGTATTLDNILISKTGTDVVRTYQVVTVNGDGVESPKVTVKLAFVPKPSLLSPTTTLCEGAIVANVASITIADGQLLATKMGSLPLFTTELLPVGSNMNYTIQQGYREPNTQNAYCLSDPVSATVTVVAKPPTPALPAQIVCTNTTTLVGTDNNYTLVVDAGQGKGIGYQIPTTAGTYDINVYYRSTTLTTCESKIPQNVRITVLAPNALTAPSISVKGYGCSTSHYTLEAKGCEAGTIQWYLSSNQNTILATGGLFNANKSTTYIAKCKLGNCESTGASLTTGNGNTSLTLKLQTNSPIAAGESLELSAEAYDANATYTWNVNNTTYTGKTLAVPNLAAGTYTVTCTATAGSCTTPSTTTVQVNQTADCAVYISATDGSTETYSFAPANNGVVKPLTLSVVDENENGTAFWGVNAGITYQWTGPNGFTSNIATPSVSKPGLYSLKMLSGTSQCAAEISLSGEPCQTVKAMYCNPASAVKAPEETTRLNYLSAGDNVFAGDFIANILTAEPTGDGKFSGTAAVSVPYLKGIALETQFTNVDFNQCLSLKNGTDNKLVTVFDPNASGIVDVDEVFIKFRQSLLEMIDLMTIFDGKCDDVQKLHDAVKEYEKAFSQSNELYSDTERTAMLAKINDLKAKRDQLISCSGCTISLRIAASSSVVSSDCGAKAILCRDVLKEMLGDDKEKKKTDPDPIPHPILAITAENIANNSEYINSLELFDDKTRTWHYAQNKNLAKNIQKPTYFPTNKSKLTSYLKKLDARKKRVLKQLANFNPDDQVSLADYDKLKQAYEKWPDRYDVYYIGVHGATCSFFVGECLEKSGLMSYQTTYLSAQQLRTSLKFKHISQDSLQRGDIVSFYYGGETYHVEIVTSVDQKNKSFCSRGAGRGSYSIWNFPHLGGDGIEKCDTWYDDTREFGNKLQLVFLRLKR